MRHVLGSALVIALSVAALLPQHARVSASASAPEHPSELRRDRQAAAAPPAAQAAPAPPSPQDKNQVFRAGVEMVSINVTVVDSQGRYVTDLAQEDFGVFEDGAKQELSYFNRTNLP